jgi:hypothetical protein
MVRPIQRIPACLSHLLLLVAFGWFPSGCDLTSPPVPGQGDASRLISSSDLGAGRGHGNADFFPLEFGNHWESAGAITVVVIPDGSDPEPPMTLRMTAKTEVTGTEILFGTSYVLVEKRWNQEGNEGTYWYRYRQDRSGLYEADVSITDPPASGLGVAASGGLMTDNPTEARWQRLAEQIRAQGASPGFLDAIEAILARHAMIREIALAIGRGTDADLPAKARRRAGPLAHELTRLSYPLHPGASWIILDVPRVTATVEGAETLDLPAGRFSTWRVRIDWPGNFGPRDLVHVWFGRCGELQFAAHLEGTATDEDGRPIGSVISDESEVLIDLDLVRGGCD